MYAGYMKSLRLDRWASQLQPPRNPRLRLLAHQRCPFSSNATAILPRAQLQQRCQRPQLQCIHQRRGVTSKRRASTVAASSRLEADVPFPDEAVGAPTQPASNLNFPSHRIAVKSAKLSALHARLYLPGKLPLETLARCLIDPSVDSRTGYNNAPLAILGQELLAYYTSEWLICKYPRIPMTVLFAAQYGYSGDATLNSIRAEWGVETVAAPGPEVDAGLLQLKRMTPGNAMAEDGMRRVKDARSAGEDKNFQRGLTQRIFEDNEFGDPRLRHELPRTTFKPYAGSPISQSAKGEQGRTTDATEQQQEQDNTTSGDTTPGTPTIDRILEIARPVDAEEPTTVEKASAGFVRALAGALYLHAGTNAVKAYHKAHILSRHLPLHSLFAFQHPTRDLSLLCQREGYEPPIARLISETGRLSRTPVFIVGVFSGNDKLGEAAGASLDEGRVRAAAAALRSWYLYSPPDSELVLPSEVEGSQKNKKAWKPQHVDPGEIVF